MRVLIAASIFLEQQEVQVACDHDHRPFLGDGFGRLTIRVVILLGWDVLHRLLERVASRFVGEPFRATQ